MGDTYVIDGYVFMNKADYERANRERETIAYLSAHSDMEDMKAVYKIYKTASEKQSFQTVFGLQYMEELREQLLNSGLVEDDVLDPIPVGRSTVVREVQASPVDRDAQEYQRMYERAKSGSMIKNLLILALLAVVVGMMVITSRNQYSIFTYFTDYKEDMRGEILDEYEEWETTLKERETALEEREKAVEEREREQGQETAKPDQ